MTAETRSPDAPRVSQCKYTNSFPFLPHLVRCIFPFTPATPLFFSIDMLGNDRRPLRPVALYELMGQRDLAMPGDHSARWLSTDLWDRRTWRCPATPPPGGSLRTYGTEGLADGRRPLRPVVLYGLMGQTDLAMPGRGRGSGRRPAAVVNTLCGVCRRYATHCVTAGTPPAGTSKMCRCDALRQPLKYVELYLGERPR